MCHDGSIQFCVHTALCVSILQCILINPLQLIFKKHGGLMVWQINWILSVLLHYTGTGKLWQIERFDG